MLIPVPELVTVFEVRPNGVLHVGAHEAEEADAYRRFDWRPVIWVEMLSDKASALRTRFADDPDTTVLEAACWDRDGEMLPIYRASNGQSSSLLAPEHHLKVHPDIAFKLDGQMTATSRLDTILPCGAKLDFVNLDIQGAELRALRGLGARIERVRWIYTEVNFRRLYQDCALVEELDSYLTAFGFERFITRLAGTAGWGDALYINTKNLSSASLAWVRLKSRFRKQHGPS